MFLSQLLKAQNTWTGSSTSTATTGNASIGTTVNNAIRFQAYNTTNTIATNISSFYNNTYSGTIYGIYNETKSTGTGTKYGVYSFMPNLGSGNRYALYGKIDEAGDSRSAYLEGTAEAKGNFIMGGNNGKFIFNHAFAANQDFMSIAPNGTGTSNTWEFNKELKFYGTGELEKTVPDANTRALSVNVAGTRAFQVMGSGKVFAREVEVTLATFPDYVFESEYPLLSLDALRNYIFEKKHLPNIPSACEIEEKGIGLGELSLKQMEKIEELTLYLLQLDERLKALEAENKALKTELSDLKTSKRK